MNKSLCPLAGRIELKATPMKITTEAVEGELK